MPQKKLTSRANHLAKAARGVVSVLLLVSISFSLTGCFKKWEMSEVEGWYEEKPQGFDDYMRLAREKTGKGETDKGMKLYEDCIKDIESQYGPDDIRIATCAEELAVLEEKLGLLSKAEDNYRRALQVREKMLPPTHLDVKRSRQKLSGILKKLGRDDEAKDVLTYGLAKKEAAETGSSSGAKKEEIRVRRHKRP